MEIGHIGRRGQNVRDHVELATWNVTDHALILRHSTAGWTAQSTSTDVLLCRISLAMNITVQVW